MLKLYYHPLASFCWKPLIALYELETPFEPVLIDLADETSRNELARVWPLLKFPVLVDAAREATVAEASVIVDYLDQFHRPADGSRRMIPADPDHAWRARMWDSFCDSYLQAPMQAVVADHFRPPGGKDPIGVQQSRDMIAAAYGVFETAMAQKTWAAGETFSLADASAAPALFYCDLLVPLKDRWPNLDAYLDRLMARPSFARVLEAAEPWFPNFPPDPKPSRTRSR
ncbi:MAG: glutathione S-transferase family protein [Hyphomonadaceae bacterium]